MPPFRKIAREIHRRSIWQVLSVYAVASWGVLEAVDVLTEMLGLPDWVPPFALVLLLIGLPMVLATAIVQEGAPGQDGSGEAPPPDGAARAPEAAGAREPTPGPADGARGEPADAGILHTLFTWRNAIVGGVLAFALLGVAVAAYFVMWATGIGPVGSLVAQGALEERDRVVVADFENSTPDATLGDVVSEALRVDLVQSPTLTVVDPSYVARVLRRMDRPDTAALTPELARELAVREGLKAVIRGGVAPAGEGFILTASIVAADDGRTLAAFRETADDAGEVIEAIDDLSQGIRERAGESLPSIKRGEPLSAVTTSSLEALRRYTRGVRLQDRGRPAEGAAALEEAVELDPGFAMAWRKLAVLRSNMGAPPARIVEAATEAYEHRHRLTDVERYLAEAYYHDAVTGDRDAQVRAYRRVLELEPDHPVALNNLGLALNREDRYREALELLERATAGPGETSTAWVNRIAALLALGEIEPARRAVERFGERYPGHGLVTWFEFLVEMVAGNGPAAHAAARALADDETVLAEWRFWGEIGPATHDLAAGKVGEARTHIEEAMALAVRTGRIRHALGQGLPYVALLGAITGDPGTVAALLDALEVRERFEALEPGIRPYGPVIRALLAADRIGEARRVYERWKAEVPEGSLGAANERPRTEALARLRMAEGADREALETFEELRAELGCQRCFRLERAGLLVRLDRRAEAIPLLESQAKEPRGTGLHYYPARRALALQRLEALEGRRTEAR